ncbi:hypothetical protein [Plesiomonas shigelloides]|uniref:hypothetical protein n=1 Tax=Plesiomonas shigelloides TaxID=703 RepID=UPI001C5B2B24|nr:hypothetical protein [Plesiomonas shigelloides]MBW3794246.1 hypothetical protein [Plesiomonas shigelloides]
MFDIKDVLICAHPYSELETRYKKETDVERRIRLEQNQCYMLIEFTRATVDASSIAIEVASVTWDGPHTPVTSWHAVSSICFASTERQINSARKKALKRRRFFTTCVICNEITPIGHMSYGGACQGCAEAYLGVVH